MSPRAIRRGWEGLAKPRSCLHAQRHQVESQPPGTWPGCTERGWEAYFPSGAIRVDSDLWGSPSPNPE